jgi:hypothetical protein
MIPSEQERNDQHGLELGQDAAAEVPVLVPCPPGAELEADLPPDLARVVDAWDELPDAIKAAIIALVETAMGRQP